MLGNDFTKSRKFSLYYFLVYWYRNCFYINIKINKKTVAFFCASVFNNFRRFLTNFSKEKEAVIMKKVFSVFCVLTALLVLPVAGQANGFDPGDYTFEGTFIFGINSMYNMNGTTNFLNVRGSLDVLDDQGVKIGDLDLYGYKRDMTQEIGDGTTYLGDWVFDSPGHPEGCPMGCLPCDCERGIFDDLSQFGEYLEVTFLGLNDELGLPGNEFTGYLEGDAVSPNHEFRG